MPWKQTIVASVSGLSVEESDHCRAFAAIIGAALGLLGLLSSRNLGHRERLHIESRAQLWTDLGNDLESSE